MLRHFDRVAFEKSNGDRLVIVLDKGVADSYQMFEDGTPSEAFLAVHEGNVAVMFLIPGGATAVMDVYQILDEKVKPRFVFNYEVDNSVKLHRVPLPPENAHEVSMSRARRGICSIECPPHGILRNYECNIATEDAVCNCDNNSCVVDCEVS